MTTETRKPEVKEWAAEVAKRELVAARNVGAVPARQWHNGRAVVMLTEAEQFAEAAALLVENLHRQGAHGTQFVAGLRSGVTLADGARSLRAMDEAANVDAWAAEHDARSAPNIDDDEQV